MLREISSSEQVRFVPPEVETRPHSPNVSELLEQLAQAETLEEQDAWMQVHQKKQQHRRQAYHLLGAEHVGPSSLHFPVLPPAGDKHCPFFFWFGGAVHTFTAVRPSFWHGNFPSAGRPGAL